MPTNDQLKTSLDSPALKVRSELYPASWHQRVPKRIVMAKTVRSDFEFIVTREKRMIAQIGVEYDCWVNSNGAVCAILEDGDLLGVKPYEFEVIEWHDEVSA